MGNFKHGMSGTRLNNIYINMVRRCYDKGHISYKHYGAKGVIVSQAWLNDRIRFFDWARYHGYRSDLSLDRINNNQGYAPLNCRWSTLDEQAANRPTNNNITEDGRTQSLSAWARELGISRRTLRRILVKEKQFLHKGK